MKQLIDKSDLVAEIRKSLLPTVIPQGTNYNEFEVGADSERIKILSLIDTLKVKEVDKEYNGKAMLHVLEMGVEQGKREILNNLWKSADGYDLPEIDREVIALVLKFGHYKVVFAHRVDENAEVHTSIDGKPLVLHPMRYDKGGWNQSDVKWWLDLELPNETDNGWLVLPDEEYQKQKEENG